MNAPDHTSSCLLTDLFGRDLIDRQPLTVAGHHQFRESIAAPSRNFDAIDDECDVVDPDDHHAHHRKSGKEVNRLLDLLDSLGNNEGGNA